MISKYNALKNYSTLPIYWNKNTPYLYETNIYNYKITAHWSKELKKYIFIKTRIN
jgi:hypothetical protein